MTVSTTMTLASAAARTMRPLVWPIVFLIVARVGPIAKNEVSRADSLLSISGNVTADGHPASGATVKLFRAGDSSSFGDVSSMGGAQQLTRAVSDSSGNFKFDGIVRGVYRLEVSLTGYVIESGITDRNGEPIYYRPGEAVHVEMTKGGVVTGRVTDPAGAPLVEVPVRAVRVKDDQGRPTFDLAIPDMTTSPLGSQWQTDDRGIYRIFGLKSGSYLVSAGGGLGIISQFSGQPYFADAPTYYPSNTRATAVEVPVRAGAEVVAIDISYQTLTGHSISGVIGGQISARSMYDFGLVILTNISTGSLDSLGIALGTGGGPRNFSIRGVPDGQYYVTALGGFGSKELTLSEPLRVSVKGADVAGLSLNLAALPQISGTLTFTPVPKTSPESKCKPSSLAAEEILLKAEKEAGRGGRGLPELERFFGSGASSPDDGGAFRFVLSSGGLYHIKSALPDSRAYIGSVKSPGPEKNSPPTDLSAGVELKMGQKLSGLSIVVGVDGASISGKVTSAKKGEPLPIDLALTIVPAQPELSDNLLRYDEVLVGDGGDFKVANLAPGKYFILLRRLGEKEWNDPDRQPSYWDARKRKDLLTEAKARSLTIDLKPCGQYDNYVVSYPQRAPAATTPVPAKP